MVIVAVDTSQRIGGVALARDGEVLGEARFGAEASHLVELGAAVEGLLEPHGADAPTRGAAGIDRVALVSGPGSFTGLRIGMAWAKGLHAATGVELVTMGTLELMALPHLQTHETVCAMLDARKGEVYAAVFARPGGDEAPLRRARVIVAPCAMPAARFMARLPEAPALFTGSGVVRYREDVEVGMPSAPAHRIAFAEPLDAPPPVAHLARVAHRLVPLGPASIPALEPDYIRPSEAELKRLKETRP